MTDLDTVRSWGCRLLEAVDWRGVFPIVLERNGWPDPAGHLFQELARVEACDPPFSTAIVFTAISIHIYAAPGTGEPWTLAILWQSDGVVGTVWLNRGHAPAASFECREHPEEIWT